MRHNASRQIRLLRSLPAWAVLSLASLLAATAAQAIGPHSESLGGVSGTDSANSLGRWAGQRFFSARPIAVTGTPPTTTLLDAGLQDDGLLRPTGSVIPPNPYDDAYVSQERSNPNKLEALRNCMAGDAEMAVEFLCRTRAPLINEVAAHIITLLPLIQRDQWGGRVFLRLLRTNYRDRLVDNFDSYRPLSRAPGEPSSRSRKRRAARAMARQRDGAGLLAEQARIFGAILEPGREYRGQLDNVFRDVPRNADQIRTALAAIRRTAVSLETYSERTRSGIRRGMNRDSPDPVWARCPGCIPNFAVCTNGRGGEILPEGYSSERLRVEWARFMSESFRRERALQCAVSVESHPILRNAARTLRTAADSLHPQTELESPFLQLPGMERLMAIPLLDQVIRGVPDRAGS